MDVLWNPPYSQAWATFHRQHQGSLQQTWAYGDALQALGVEVLRVCALDQGQLKACAQFICRRFLGYLSLVSCARGPVFDPAWDDRSKRDFYAKVRASLPVKPLRVCVFSPNVDASQWDPQEVQGLRRVLTGYSTSLIDLSRSADELKADMDSKWRNRLTRAMGQAEMKVFAQPSRSQLDFLLAREAEQRKRRGFFGLPPDFAVAYVQAHDKPAQAFRLVWAQRQKETVAAMLFLLHGRVATYHMGWSNEAGRDLNAHNALLWRAMQELPQIGIDLLDMGGVNTEDLAGISRFKLGAGGRVCTLPGTFF